MELTLIQKIAIYALPVIFAITVHEAAHGYAARYFGDMTAYLTSLRRLRSLDLACILPGHGAPIERPYEKIDEYLAHRLMRERQIGEALGAGVVTIPAIVARLYVGLAPVLLGAAAATVRAHLVKLIRDGVVVEEGAGYRLA